MTYHGVLAERLELLLSSLVSVKPILVGRLQAQAVSYVLNSVAGKTNVYLRLLDPAVVASRKEAQGEIEAAGEEKQRGAQRSIYST